jgi:hypothetical protein
MPAEPQPYKRSTSQSDLHELRLERKTPQHDPAIGAPLDNRAGEGRASDEVAPAVEENWVSAYTAALGELADLIEHARYLEAAAEQQRIGGDEQQPRESVRVVNDGMRVHLCPRLHLLTLAAASITHEAPLHFRAEALAWNTGDVFYVRRVLRGYTADEPLPDHAGLLDVVAALIEQLHQRRTPSDF